MKTLKSMLDQSVNFVLESGQEARYVRREEAYFIVYLSSHNGCNKACRFCHLTQTGQVSFDETTFEQFIEQAKIVIEHYREQVASGAEPAAVRVNFNWMARGEPLDNAVVTGRWGELVEELHQLASGVGIFDVNFNISTILPETFVGDFCFSGVVQPHVYYSLYSLDERFRKRWLPKAKSPVDALELLVDWQRRSSGQVTLHWAMIEGQNDDAKTMDEIVREVTRAGLDAKFNLVRYNPYSSEQGNEPVEEVLVQRFKQILPFMRVEGSRIVPRVGFDVKASCGMFVAKSVVEN